MLQTEPQYIARLAKFVNMGEMDTLLQTVMFTIYGNQYESREEHLLLTVFQVSLSFSPIFFIFFFIIKKMCFELTFFPCFFFPWETEGIGGTV